MFDWKKVFTLGFSALMSLITPTSPYSDPEDARWLERGLFGGKRQGNVLDMGVDHRYDQLSDDTNTFNVTPDHNGGYNVSYGSDEVDDETDDYEEDE